MRHESDEHDATHCRNQRSSPKGTNQECVPVPGCRFGSRNLCDWRHPMCACQCGRFCGQFHADTARTGWSRRRRGRRRAPLSAKRPQRASTFQRRQSISAGFRSAGRGAGRCGSSSRAWLPRPQRTAQPSRLIQQSLATAWKFRAAGNPANNSEALEAVSIRFAYRNGSALSNSGSRFGLGRRFQQRALLLGQLSRAAQFLSAPLVAAAI